MAYDIEISKRTYILITIQIFYVQLLSGIFDNFRSIVLSSLKEDYGLSHQDVSWVVTGLGYVYVLVGFLVAWSVQTFSYKVTILIGLSCWLIGSAAIFFSYTIPTILVSLVVIWFGTCFIQVGNNSIATAVFVKHRTFMISMIHFVFGLGTIISPIISRNIIPLFTISFRASYMVTILPIVLGYIYILCIKYDFKRKEIKGSNKPPLKMSQLLKTGHLWMFAITYSFFAAVTYIGVDYPLLYLKDIYGWDPTTQGTNYMTLYSFGYAFSRVIIAFIGERVNAYTMYYICIGINLFLYLLGFCLGENGIYILALTGFPVGTYWPLIIVINMEFWEENAPIASSLMTSLQGICKEIWNLLCGFLNETIGIYWGYKILIPYIICACIGLIIINVEYKKKLRRKSKSKDIEMGTNVASEQKMNEIVTEEKKEIEMNEKSVSEVVQKGTPVSASPVASPVVDQQVSGSEPKVNEVRQEK